MKRKVKKVSLNELKKIIKEQNIKINNLENELKQKKLELEMFCELSNTVVSNNLLEETLGLIVTLTAEMTKTKICSIMLLDEKKGELVIKATQSLSEKYINKPNIKVGQSISGLAVEEKRPITVLDVTQEPRYAYPELAKELGIKSMLAVPMFFKDKVIGVLNIYTSFLHEFTNEEIRVLQTIANQAAITIENNKLMTEIQKTKELLEIRKIVERAKGILMRQKGFSEDEAYRFIQKKSMDTGRPMKEVSQAIILAFES